MECRLKCEKPNEIVYTMTITMRADEWEKLRDQLQEAKTSYIYPAQSLVQSINDLLGQARKIYWPKPAPEVNADEGKTR
jgi:hypothetical protein